MKEAMFYEKLVDNQIRCYLCSHNCAIPEGKRGICGVRKNNGGRLETLVYGRLVSQHLDPVEKKPLFHFLTGSKTYSISTVGCNFKCLHCQNWQISQYPHLTNGEITGEVVSPREVVEAALASGANSISYTYVEPTIFFEFARDCALLAREKGIRNIFVSNGYMSEQAARDLATFIDAINIDIKAFSDEFYKKVCRAKLAPVLANVKLLHELGVWVEITTLIIPGYNDKQDELRALATFIKDVSPSMPWHISAFHPAYRMLDVQSTPVTTLDMAMQIGLETGLQFVYEGNVPGRGKENTYCPRCGALLVKRSGFSATIAGLENGKCKKCELEIRGVWH